MLRIPRALDRFYFKFDFIFFNQPFNSPISKMVVSVVDGVNISVCFINFESCLKPLLVIRGLILTTLNKVVGVWGN